MQRTVFWIFITGCVLFYLGPIVEGDFFWHLRAGERIVEEGGIHNLEFPTQWLGQVLLYFIWQAGGAGAMVVTRAAVYAVILILLYKWIRKEGVGVYSGLFILFFPAVLFISFPNERPQLFSFLLFPLMVRVLESYRKGAGYWSMAALALMLIVWANVHSGFLLGYACAWAYFLVALAGAYRRRVPLARAAALGAVIVSPALLFFFSGSDLPTYVKTLWYYLVHTDPYSKSLQENIPPFVAARDMADYYPAYWGFLILAIAAVWRGLRSRSMPAEHAVLLLVFSALSLKALRFMPYPLLLVPLAARHVDGILPLKERGPVGPIVLGVVLAAWMALAPPKVSLDVSADFPKDAVGFLKEAPIGSNIFNYHGWTGYLYWMLPERRSLMRIEGVTMEMEDAYDKIIWADQTLAMGSPQWRTLLDAYGLGVIIVPGISPVSGEKFPILEELLLARDWYLVYTDEVANIYLRDHPKNAETIRLRSLPKSNAYLQAVSQARRYLIADPHRAQLWKTLEALYHRLGLKKEEEMAARHELPAPI